MKRLTKTLPKATRALLLLTLTLTSMSWSGCGTVKIIPADQAETHLKAGKPFTPPADGVFMQDARYQRYRRAVADAILVEQLRTTNQ